MGYKVHVWVFALLILWTSNACADSSCYVVDEKGAGQSIPFWSRIVVREIEPAPKTADETHAGGPLDSPRVLSDFVYQGAVIPVRDLLYMLPALGVYVFKDDHRIDANPLASCGFSREHRFVDLENPRHRTTAAGPDIPSRPDVLLELEVFLEFAATDTVAGYPVETPRLLPLHDARIVVFDPGMFDAAKALWASVDRSSGPAVQFSPFAARLEKNTDLRIAPDGDGIAKLKKGGTVEVLELSGEWARVRAEGWVKRDAVEGRGR